MTWLRIIRFIASLLPCRKIYAENGALYLERFCVFGWQEGSNWRGPSLYLHRFHLPDQDTVTHNHPWRRAFSVVLSGGYTEERCFGFRMLDSWTYVTKAYPDRTLKAGSLNIIGPDTYHRITQIHGETWTLFFVWPKSRSWGFLVPGRGHVEWRERLRERGIEV